jgi:hypothetical protein
LNSGEKLFFGRGNYFTFPDNHPNPDLSLGLMAAAERRADRVLGWDFSFGV